MSLNGHEIEAPGEYLSARATADLLGLTYNETLQLLADGKIKNYRTGIGRSGAYRVTRTAAIAYRDQRIEEGES